MDALIKQGILFEIFLQFSLPPPIQCWNSDADVERCLWGCWGGGGRGWVSVNWQKDSQFKCVSGLLSMIAVTGRLQFLSTFEVIDIQIQEFISIVIYSYLEKSCRKKCTRQSWKVLWLVLSSLFFRKRKKFETMAREAMALCLRVLKESNKSRFDSYSVRNNVLVISHITFRDCRVQFFPDNLARNSCTQRKCQVLGHCVYSSQAL